MIKIKIKFLAICRHADNKFSYLNVSFVRIDRTSKLSFLSNSVSEDDDLFKEKDSHFLEFVVWTAGWIVGTEEGTVQQQLALCNYLTLQQKLGSNHLDF